MVDHSITEARNNDELDLGQLLLDIIKFWKSIFLVTFVGTSVAIIMALMIPKEYKPSANLTLPKDVYVEQFNQLGLITLSRDELFKRYYQALRSEANFRNFITEHDFIRELYVGYEQQNSAQLMADATERFSVEILEPVAVGGIKADFPNLIQVSLHHGDEATVVNLLNTYIEYTNTGLVNDFIDQFKQIKTQREEQINQQIALLRQAAKYKRELEITRREATNNLKLQQLKEEIQLLVKLAEGNRRTQLAEVNEALIIATTLNINDPTPIGEFIASNREATTNIMLSSNQTLPLYLMGTRYLKALTDTLNSRKDESIFISRINELKKEIEEIENDQALAQLKARVSDDPYIDRLPELINQLNKLQVNTLETKNLQLYQTQKPASVTRKAIKPNRAHIAIFGFVFSGLVALIIAMVRASLARRTSSNVY